MMFPRCIVLCFLLLGLYARDLSAPPRRHSCPPIMRESSTDGSIDAPYVFASNNDAKRAARRRGEGGFVARILEDGSFHIVLVRALHLDGDREL